MRIVSGKLKARRITAPKNLPVRPTTDMAKESLFNILNNWYYFHELKVLDLFAGTGNISYEFASRGTEFIKAVDSHHGCVQFINETAKKFDLIIDTVKSDVYGFLEKHSASYDVIFADPPYDFSDESFAKIVELIFANNLLNKTGTLVIEHSERTNLSELPYFDQSKRYGGCQFSFFEYPESEGDQ